MMAKQYSPEREPTTCHDGVHFSSESELRTRKNLEEIGVITDCGASVV
jgi:hypothetical protein